MSAPTTPGSEPAAPTVAPDPPTSTAPVGVEVSAEIADTPAEPPQPDAPAAPDAPAPGPPPPRPPPHPPAPSKASPPVRASKAVSPGKSLEPSTTTPSPINGRRVRRGICVSTVLGSGT